MSLKDYRWDVFLSHNPQTLVPEGLSFELCNQIRPEDLPDKMQYGVKVIVDQQFDIADAQADKLSVQSEFLASQNDQDLDNLSIWSGCGIRENHSDYLYYTGVSRQELADMDSPENPSSLGMIPQRIFVAISTDEGQNWQRGDNNPLIDLNDASNLWYERSAQDNQVHGQVSANSACRDPFVYKATTVLNLFSDDAETLEHGKYYLLFTARVNQDFAPADTDIHFRGCIGVASADNPQGPFKLQAPILNLGLFGDMELPHLVMNRGELFLFFCVQDRCIDGSISTDPEFLKRLGVPPYARCSYGYRFDSVDHQWRPMNARGGWVESPQGLYGIRFFEDPANAHSSGAEAYGARGFVIPVDDVNEEDREDGLAEFTLSPLMQIDWPSNNLVRAWLPERD